MRIALSEMSDQELLKNHFKSGDEMLKRNMVVVLVFEINEQI